MGENFSASNIVDANYDLVEFDELLVVSANISSVVHCASIASPDCDMSFRTTWVLDSSCSYHMCPHREWFTTYEPLNGG